MRYLGIDYGTKRVGVALSDEHNEFALPRAVLPNDDELIRKICECCRENDVGAVVIGESRNLSGEANPLLKNIAAFAQALQNFCGIEVHFEPEFFTTAQARRIQGNVEKLDASAAALILQSFLERQKL